MINLPSSEAVVASAAATIYAAYCVSGRVEKGKEKEAMQQAVRDATYLHRRSMKGFRVMTS